MQNDPNEMKNIYGDPNYTEIQTELHNELEKLRENYEDNDLISQAFIEDYYNRVKENPLIEYWKLPPSEMQKLYQEYIKNRN